MVILVNQITDQL